MTEQEYINATNKPEFRVSIVPAMDTRGYKNLELYFGTIEEAKAATETAGMLLLFLQDDLRVMSDESNMIYIEQYVEGDWEELEESE